MELLDLIPNFGNYLLSAQSIVRGNCPHPDLSYPYNLVPQQCVVNGQCNIFSCYSSITEGRGGGYFCYLPFNLYRLYFGDYLNAPKSCHVIIRFVCKVGTYYTKPEYI
jgi:hypothetical protein